MDPVLDLLKKENLKFTVSGQDYLIKCLNPDHEDSNPSCRVDKVTGITHCFSCGFKTNIFKFFNIVDNFTSIKIAKLKAKLTELKINSNGVEFPEAITPVTKPFRGISTKTLKEFDSFYVNNANSELTDRIWFPIKDIRDRVVVYVGRHTLSDSNPRYLNYPKGVQMPIYPETFKNRYKSVVLVEGIFDMLNLYDKGLENVSCTFGTSTLFKDADIKLLSLKSQGISKIYLMFDGDEPGREAMDKLEPILLEELGFMVEKIILPEDSDPGELSQEYVNSIKEYISEKDSNSRQSS